MFHSLILSILISFLAIRPGDQPPKVGLALCNITHRNISSDYSDSSARLVLSGIPISLSALKECGDVNIIIDKGWEYYYKDARIVSFLFNYVRMEGRTGSPIFEQQFNGIISDKMKAHLKNAKAGDMMYLMNIKISTDAGKNIIDGRTATYIVTD
jgi:hypothetical protein